ncbi:MAG: phosphatidylglycerol lysyltransferase [Treponema sp.]|jgi:phosphoglucomutase|nr:phosphatidylglycerol lysyltransferase [Treponema sp.]
MVTKEAVCAVVDKMILSASGWRGIFAMPDKSGSLDEHEHDNEENATNQIDEVHRLISAAAAMIFAGYLQKSNENSRKSTVVLLGTDTRPTGEAISGAMIPALLSCGCNVHYAGFTAAPEIMAWARNRAEDVSGFIYISASHNPIGHNGIKFGLTDGGVLAGEESLKIIADFRSFINNDDCVEKLEVLISRADSQQLKKVYDGAAAAKAEARKSYYDFCGDVVWGGNPVIAAALKDGLAKQPLGVVCDFNGSARTVSIDSDFFSALGLKFDCINSEPGKIVHRIVPEGESLEPCRELLEKIHSRDASFALGYVPDCDGDRGNLVIWDDTLGKGRALEAQEVFALACVAELSHLVWTDGIAYDKNGNAVSKAAVAANDPTSMRIDRIAEAFGIQVFRAEVGEANVVGLARRLRKEGYVVRILGEGSAGGNITHPSAVRDPLNTVLAIVKLLSVRSFSDKSGLFEIWCRCSGQMEKYRDDFNLADIIESLPKFATTPAYSKDAVLRIKTPDHGVLKDRYQQIFLREWENQKDELKTRFGFYGWEAIAYNGMDEKRSLSRFGDAGRGGLKINFLNKEGKAAAYIWMRGSGTEPVFRIMADVESHKEEDSQIEKFLLEWQSRMIKDADKE